MSDVRGKVVVVTGGAGILGSQFSRALSGNGADVVLLDRDIRRAEAVAADIASELDPSSDGRIVAYEADVASKEEMESAKRRIETELGVPHVLVNNAATKTENFFEPFESFPLDDWNRVLEVNTTGVMIGCQVFGPSMVERGCGSIINILSIYGIVAPDQRIYEGAEYEGKTINTPAVYSASKAAVLGLTRYLASYWGDRGVRVNAVTPGGVYSGQNTEFVNRYSKRAMLRRMGEPDEICGAVVYLASDASSYVTGHNLVVDGGFTAW